MSTSGHVFVSYLREDSEKVDRLVQALRDSNINVWVDRENIEPGQRWEISIRRAIQSGNYFLACFSNSYAVRDKSYMNAELVIAIEELRKYAHDRPWFIPVLLSQIQIPDISIGKGETLESLQWVTLFDNWECGVEKIVRVTKQSRRNQILPPPDKEKTEKKEKSLNEDIITTQVINEHRETEQLIKNDNRGDDSPSMAITKIASLGDSLSAAASEMIDTFRLHLRKMKPFSKRAYAEWEKIDKIKSAWENDPYIRGEDMETYNKVVEAWKQKKPNGNT